MCVDKSKRCATWGMLLFDGVLLMFNVSGGKRQDVPLNIPPPPPTPPLPSMLGCREISPCPGAGASPCRGDCANGLLGVSGVRGVSCMDTRRVEETARCDGATGFICRDAWREP